MKEAVNEFLQNAAAESQGRWQAMERILSSADAAKVFSQPVMSGQHTVITACEVGSGGGFGSGMGFGLPGSRRRVVADESGAEPGGAAADGTAAEGAGGGGGGGGGSMGRPVAAIVISPDGVQVKPVLDVTKVTLAALTAFGAMGVLALKILAKR